MKKVIIFISLCITFLSALADIRLPSILSSHMVLQQKSKVKIWGWSAPGEKISMRVGWDTTQYQVTATRGAKWMIEVATPTAGGPYTIQLKGSNEIVLEDVMVGEVWVCGGQSNMEWSGNQKLPQSIEESPKANNTKIRFFYVPKSTSEFPQEDVESRWVVCDPASMFQFSAIGYFFGKQVTEQTGNSVGLINSNWGGTPAEVWTPYDVVANDPDLRAAADKLNPSPWWPHVRGEAYNAMIYPLINYAIAGALWYQGESNVSTHYTYRRLFTSMIDSWRKAWGKNFPFYFVQIAPYTYGDNHINGALLREAQTQSALHPNTGMVVVSDLVNNVKDIHPILKKEVALRLANMAMAELYGIKGLNYKSPTYASHQVENGAIRVAFNHVPTSLISKGGDPTDFYIAGEDGNYIPAKAKIDGKSVLVSSKQVKQPVSVRFGFTNTAMPNLFTAEGLPVNLFRAGEEK
jgi:sialate O-acetylesterase